MSTFIMLTRLAPDAVRSPQALEALERQAVAAVREECPQAKWLHSFAIMGPFDYLDVIEAPSLDVVTKVATLVRIAGHAHVEVWPATEWRAYRDLLRSLPASEALTVATH